MDQVPKPPPSLANNPSAFERSRSRWGEPITLGFEIQPDLFARVCDEFDEADVVTALSDFSDNQELMHRLWPITAAVLDAYEFESRERPKRPGASPTHVRNLLTRIEKSSEKLGEALAELYSLGNDLPTPGQPEVQGHIRWLTDILCQSFTDQPLDQEIDDSDRAWFERECKRGHFMRQLATLSACAEHAQSCIELDLLTRSKQPTQPQLYNFVHRVGLIWDELTGRVPTVNQSGNDAPEFVRFVQSLAAITNQHPTWAMIRTAHQNQPGG